MKKIFSLLIVIAFAISFCNAQSYLPLSAGLGNPLTGILYLNGTNGYGLVFETAGANTGLLSNNYNIVGSGSTTDFNAYVYGNNPFGIWTNGARRLIVDGSGNVGIGTTTPNWKLDIQGVGTTTSLHINRTDGTPASWYLHSGRLGTGEFSIGDDIAYRLIIASNGNVGIGTTIPATALDVNGVINSNNDIISTNGTIKAFLSVSNSYNTGVIGTQTNHGLAFYINSLPVARFTTNGNFGIGTTTPDQLLTVNGTAHAKEVLVDLTGFPDYVFKSSYHLPTLIEVKTYIDQNHHLPEMPTEAEVIKSGLKVGETEALLTKKVEELTLYLIEKDKQLKQQETRLQRLEAQFKSHANKPKPFTQPKSH